VTVYDGVAGLALETGLAAEVVLVDGSGVNSMSEPSMEEAAALAFSSIFFCSRAFRLRRASSDMALPVEVASLASLASTSEI
jgi:hypothetical protein